MKPNSCLLFSLAIAAVFSSCGRRAAGPVMEINSPYVVGENDQFFPGDPKRNAQAALGRRLFYDNRLSAANDVNCGSCHKAEAAFGDHVAFSQGTDGKLLEENTVALTRDGSGSAVTGWGPMHASFREHIFDGPAHQLAMGFRDGGDLAERIRQDQSYTPLFEAAYGTGEVTLPVIAGAINEFVDALKMLPPDGNAPQVVKAVIKNPDAVRLTVVRYKCSVCHAGAGIAANTTAGAGISSDWNIGTAESPALTNIAISYPYLRDGSVPSLEGMLQQMSNGQGAHPLPVGADGRRQALPMTAEERGYLLQWMNSLTDRSRMDDPRFSNPFTANAAN